MNTENLPQKNLTGSPLMKSYVSKISFQDTIKSALGDQAGAFSASLIELYGSDNSLKNCDPSLVIAEAMKAASLKLPIVKAMGFAYIVAFKNKSGDFIPTMQIGYKGFLQLAQRTGMYRFINAGEVYEGEFQKKDKLTGAIDISGEKTSDKVVGYFAYMETLNGFTKSLYWTVEELKKHASKYSKTYPNFIWKSEFDKMAIKTILSNLISHYGYLSIEMLSAMQGEEKSDEHESESIVSQHANRSVLEPEYEVNSKQEYNKSSESENLEDPGF